MAATPLKNVETTCNFNRRTSSVWILSPVWWMVAILLLGGARTLVRAAKEKDTLRVHVDVGWPADRYSPIREAYEFVARTNESLIETFWDVDPSVFESTKSRSEMIDRVVAVVGHFFEEEEWKAILRLTLETSSLHSIVESRRDTEAEMICRESREKSSNSASSYPVLRAWVVDENTGAVACSPGDLTKKDASYVVHGTPGTRSFFQFRQKIDRLNGRIASLRHVVAERKTREGADNDVVRSNERESSSKSALSGWGVALDIKNMEYKAYDDRDYDDDDDDGVDDDRKHDANGGGGGGKGGGRGGGGATTDDIKVWELSEIELQTAQYVLGSENSLRRLKRVTQNFPSHAKSLTRLRVDPELVEAVDRTRASIQRSGQDDVDSFVTLNGILIDADTPDFDVHETIGKIVEETKLAFARRRFQRDSRLSDETMRALDNLAKTTGEKYEQAPRVDVRIGAKGSVLFLNNIEKDAAYQGWSKSLRTLMRPSWG
eukprot:g5189.t1